MPRPLRHDRPGTLHHATNRGTGHRPIFESSADIRTFLRLVACCARRGLIEVIAYTILTTHFHLLVRSLTGELSACLQWIQGLYGSYFNWTREKHGGVFGDRFRSKIVTSRRYERAAVWYFDRNAVEAGIVDSPEEYPWASCGQYVWRKGPPWLSRSLVEATVARLAGTEMFDPRTYVPAFSGRSSPGLYDLVDRMMRSGVEEPWAQLDDLVGAAPEHVQRWFAENAANADGGPTHVIVASAATMQELIKERRREDPDRKVQGRRRPISVWDVLEVALLWRICGLTISKTADRCQVSMGTVKNRTAIHDRLAREPSDYRVLAADLLEESIARDIRPLLG